MIQDDGSLFAVAGHPHAAWATWLGLVAMRHRANGGAGLLVSDGMTLRGVWRPGLLGSRSDGPDLDTLRGGLALGRLSAGSRDPSAASVAPQEPIRRWWVEGQIGVAVAGRLTNGEGLRRQILKSRRALVGTSDAELVAALLAQGQGSSVVSSVIHALFDLRGAFNLVVVTPQVLVACRDPWGFRPLFHGTIDGAVAVATEGHALHQVGARQIREIEPGEVLVVEDGQTATLRPFLRAEGQRAASLVDLVLLAHPYGHVADEPIQQVRQALGRALAAEEPTPQAVSVVGLSAGLDVARGFASVSGLPLRTLLHPNLEPRDHLSPPRPLNQSGAAAQVQLDGEPDESVALVVPAIVSARDLTPTLQALHRAGVGTIHLRVATPPIVAAEPYGLTSPLPEQLFANRFPALDEQARALGVASVGYLSHEGLRACVPSWSKGWCDTPWSRALPLPADEPDAQLDLGFAPSSTDDTKDPRQVSHDKFSTSADGSR